MVTDKKPVIIVFIILAAIFLKIEFLAKFLQILKFIENMDLQAKIGK